MFRFDETILHRVVEALVHREYTPNRQQLIRICHTGPVRVVLLLLDQVPTRSAKAAESVVWAVTKPAPALSSNDATESNIMAEYVATETKVYSESGAHTLGVGEDDMGGGCR